MKVLEQISGEKFRLEYNGLVDMGELQRPLVGFINECLNVSVLKIDVDLFAEKITITTQEILDNKITIKDRLRGHSDFSIKWQTNSYIMKWSRVETCTSQHVVESKDYLRNVYKEGKLPPCTENHHFEKWEIVDIVEK